MLADLSITVAGEAWRVYCTCDPSITAHYGTISGRIAATAFAALRWRLYLVLHERKSCQISQTGHRATQSLTVIVIWLTPVSVNAVTHDVRRDLLFYGGRSYRVWRLHSPWDTLCQRCEELMRVHVRSFSLASLYLGIVGCGGGSSSSPPSGAQPVALGSTIDSLENTAMLQQGQPGMIIALAKNGPVLYVKAYGVSNLATNLPTQTNTIFEIGSITKQFTAALIMKLQEQGKLQVDDPLDKYLPEYNFSFAITPRMLRPLRTGWNNNGIWPTAVSRVASETPFVAHRNIEER